MKTYIDIFQQHDGAVVAKGTRAKKIVFLFKYLDLNIFQGEFRYWAMPPLTTIRWHIGNYKGKTSPLEK